MKIDDKFEKRIRELGLIVKVLPGKQLDRLHFIVDGVPVVGTFDLWFDKDGGFDGTGGGAK